MEWWSWSSGPTSGPEWWWCRSRRTPQSMIPLLVESDALSPESLSCSRAEVNRVTRQDPTHRFLRSPGTRGWSGAQCFLHRPQTCWLCRQTGDQELVSDGVDVEQENALKLLTTREVRDTGLQSLRPVVLSFCGQGWWWRFSLSVFIGTMLLGGWRDRVFVGVLPLKKPFDTPLQDGESCHCGIGGRTTEVVEVPRSPCWAGEVELLSWSYCKESWGKVSGLSFFLSMQ